MSDKAANVSKPKYTKLIVEKDVQIPLRDGTLLYADVFRPDSGTEKVPAIMNISVYQKDKLWVPPADLEEKANPYMNWETVNPELVVPARLRLRARRLRAARASRPANPSPARTRKALDFYDAIEWIAKRRLVLGKHRHCSAFRITRRRNGASPTCSRRR